MHINETKENSFSGCNLSMLKQNIKVKTEKPHTEVIFELRKYKYFVLCIRN